MASNSILKLQVDDKQYEASLKSAQQGLQALMNALRNSGKSFSDLDKNTAQYVRALGNMEATAKTTRGRIGEMSSAFVELSQVEKQLTDQERQSPVGKALTESLNQLKQRTIEAKQELEDLDKQLTSQKAPATTGGGLFGGGKLDGMLQVFGGNVMTKVAGMATGLVTEMGDAVKQGIELARQGEGIRIAFQRLGRGDILDGLRQATHGTVTDLELMKAAVKFNDFKLPVEELGTMLAFAQQKAKDTGQSVDYMVDSIVTGLGRKSLMILDNLGLSANEIKEKMKQTGDMTKAVGQIIREQMAKAGDYVETAADRATKADVELKNAMEELGRTFQPLTDAGTSMFTALEVGALKFLSKVGSVIAQLTEAGRIASLYNNQGGSGQVSNMLNYLKSIKTDKYRQGTYKLQVGRFNEKINSYQQYLDDYKAWRDNKSIAAYDRMKAFQQRTGLSYYSDVKEQMGVYQRELNEYIQGAAGILNPTVPTKTTSNPKKTTKETKTEQTELQKNQAKINELTQEFVKLGDESTEVARERQAEIQKEIELLKERNGLLGLRAEQAQGRLTLGAGDFQRDGLSNTPGTLLKASDTTIPRGGLQLSDKQMNAVQKNIDKQMKGVGNIADEWSGVASAIGAVGNAMAGIEDPAAKVLGIVAQAIATVALTFSKSLAGTVTPWNWIAAAAAGTATMISTISAIHSATGYAEGGIIKGNSYSGDNLMAMGPNGLIGLNAGEIVLNKAQTANVANALQGGGMQGLNLTATIRGEQIRLALNNNGRRTGRGEYVQSNKR